MDLDVHARLTIYEEDVARHARRMIRLRDGRIASDEAISRDSMTMVSPSGLPPVS